MESLSAQTRILELLSCKSETINLVQQMGALLEDCIPDSSTWILKANQSDNSVREIYFSPRKDHLSTNTEDRQPVAAKIWELVNKLGPDGRIPDVASHELYADICAIFRDHPPASLLSLRIRPSNSHAWGCICVAIGSKTSPRADTRDILADAELWVKFAATILERRILEERLRTVETRLDLATKAGGIGIFDWEIPSGKLHWTPQQFDVYEVTPSTFTPSYEEWRRMVLPEDLAVIDDTLRSTFQKRERYFETRHRTRNSRGEIRWIRSLGEIIYDVHGTPIRLVGTSQDTTQEVHAREQMTLDRRRLELALEAGELGFWDWNIPSGEVQFGGEWARMLGYVPEEIERHVRGWERLIHPDDAAAVHAALEIHLKGESPIFETEHRLQHKNGSWIWVLDRGRVVERDYQGNPIRAIGIHANISIQRENRERLREEDRRKDEFLATLAHELRNPLAPIRTGLAIIKRDPSGLAAKQSLGIMERQLAHMVRLIDDLLDVSRITLGRLKLKREEISIRSIVEMAVESSRPAIDAGRHNLTVSLPPQEVMIACDPTRLAQIISNLLNNSAKYTPDRGLISVTVNVKVEGIVMSVSDDGLGIPPELQDKVFELFGQINRTLDRSQGGLGIGLALVRNLVTLHGGTVGVSSPGIGKGSTFSITLPPSVLRVPLENKGALSPETQAHPHRRVLIVDDNVDAAESLSMLARLMGHTTEVAISGLEALKRVATFHPEVVFLDIGLPGMSGFEVARAIKESSSSPLPYVVAVTGWGSEETKRKAHDAGFDDHLTKPVEVAKLERILAEGCLKEGDTAPRSVDATMR